MVKITFKKKFSMKIYDYLTFQIFSRIFQLSLFFWIFGGISNFFSQFFQFFDISNGFSEIFN